MSKIKVRKALKTLSKMCEYSFCDSCPFKVENTGLYSGRDCALKKVSPLGYKHFADDGKVKIFEEVLNNAGSRQS